MDDICELLIIAPDDYDAFRNIPTNDLPDTYDEWLKLTAEFKRERGEKGFRTVDIQGYSREFAAYLLRVGQPGNRKTIGDYALEKRLGNHY